MKNGLPLFQALFCLTKKKKDNNNNNNNQIHPVDLLQRYQCTMKFWYRHIIVSKSERKKKKSSYSDQSGRASTKLANSRDENAERKVQRVTFRVAVSAPWPYNMPPSLNSREGGRVPHALARVENTCT